MNHTLRSGIIALCLSAPSNAEIPMLRSLEKIVLLSKKHFFVEARSEKLPGAHYFQDVERLDMLHDLLAAKNSPPDLILALGVAMPNATITTEAPAVVRVVDKELRGKNLEVFNTAVSVNGFNGHVSDLLSTLPIKNCRVFLRQVGFGGGEFKKLLKMNFELKQFSYAGTLRGLLTKLAIQSGPSGSYFATFLDDSRLSVEFFPFE